jgi:type IX secretion system PorP/SprF family membrane protein
MKKTILLLTTLVLTATAQAQLGTPLSQYSGNQLVYNPGYAGIYDLLAINLTARQSWFGLPGAPAFININGHAPFENQRHSWGWVYQHERWGALSGNMLHGNYAYKMELSQGILSLGLQLGILHHLVDWGRIREGHIADLDDPTLGDNYRHDVKFDANFGAYFLAENWYAGLSTMHLTQPRYGIHTFEETQEEWYSQMRTQFHLMGGYNYEIGFDWSLRPEVVMRYVHTTPVLVNAGLHVFYENIYGVGLNFVTGQRTINFNFRANLGDYFRIGYSYGIIYGVLRPHQRGSHEISLGYSRPLWQPAFGGRTAMHWL